MNEESVCRTIALVRGISPGDSGCHRHKWVRLLTEINPLPPIPTLLTLMLLVADLVNTKLCKNLEKRLKPWNMGAHLRVLSKGYLMNTNMKGFRCLFENLCVLVSIRGVKKRLRNSLTLYCRKSPCCFLLQSAVVLSISPVIPITVISGSKG